MAKLKKVDLLYKSTNVVDKVYTLSTMKKGVTMEINFDTNIELQKGDYYDENLCEKLFVFKNFFKGIYNTIYEK